jgi:hypothetical protein
MMIGLKVERLELDGEGEKKKRRPTYDTVATLMYPGNEASRAWQVVVLEHKEAFQDEENIFAA